MALKIGLDRLVTVSIWFGQLGWKVVGLVKSVVRPTNRTVRMEPSGSTFFFSPLSPLLPACAGRALLAHWNPPPHRHPLHWKSQKAFPLLAHRKGPHLALEMETPPPKTLLEPFFACSSPLFFHFFKLFFTSFQYNLFSFIFIIFYFMMFKTYDFNLN